MKNGRCIREGLMMAVCAGALMTRGGQKKMKGHIYTVLCLAFISCFLAGHAGDAYAQVACTASAAVPETVRAQGLAEKVGDMVLSCTGTTPSAITANIQVFLTTSITNNTQGDTTDALLVLDEPPPGFQQLNVNVFRGRRSATNSVSWTGIPLASAAGPVTRIVRITNIRANANGVAPPGPAPSQILALVSLTATPPVAVINPTQVVAFVVQGMNFSVTGLAGAPVQFPMTFSESFGSAFKKRVEVNVSGNPINQNIPGNIYSTESGFTSSATGESGKATTGTRLVARFKNVPAGVTLIVPTLLPSNTSLLLARLTRKTGVVPLTSGAGFAIWEVTGGPGITGSLGIDTFIIPVSVSFAPGVPGLGPMTVTGSLGPLSSAPTTATSLAAVPRFVNAIPELWTYPGVFRSGGWFLDQSRNGGWGGCISDACLSFGLPADVPVVGDWNGDGLSDIGAFRNGTWILDSNSSGAWDPGVDKLFSFGLPTDKPVTGDWNGSGTTKVGTFRNGTWALDFNGNGAWEGPVTDKLFTFGLLTDKPVTGDWNGDGRTKIGVFRNGTWVLDYNGNGIWEPGIDKMSAFGIGTDVPVTGDWNGDGITDIGVFRIGTWVLDFNGNGKWDGAAIDKVFTFGLAADKPVSGGW